MKYIMMVSRWLKVAECVSLCEIETNVDLMIRLKEILEAP
jgi:hypothetical protein